MARVLVEVARFKEKWEAMTFAQVHLSIYGNYLEVFHSRFEETWNGSTEELKKSELPWLVGWIDREVD